jgi:hypothetical protein
METWRMEALYKAMRMRRIAVILCQLLGVDAGILARRWKRMLLIDARGIIDARDIDEVYLTG